MKSYYFDSNQTIQTLACELWTDQFKEITTI